MILTNEGYKMRHKGKSFLFPLYKPMDSAFYKWFRNRPESPIVFEIVEDDLSVDLWKGI
jgi:hypothetical protein